MTLLKKLLPVVALTTILLGFGVQSASADVITLTLGVPNPGISAYTAGVNGYATVQIDRTSSTMATITFTGQDGTGPGCTSTASPCHFLMGGTDSMDLNVNASSFTVGTITSTPTAGAFTIGSGNADGFGFFNLNIANFDGFTNAFGTAQFTITAAAGTNWTTAAQVLTANSHNAEAAAHIFVALNNGANSGATGYAANGGATVPDGGTTASLLGLALAVGGFVSRRKK